MRYIWQAPGGRGSRGTRVMHIEAFDCLGNSTMTSLCGRSPRGGFDRSINAPFALGRPVCRLCERLVLPKVAP